MNAPDSTAELAPVVKQVTVSLDPAAAFELFTAGMDKWWPLETHSVGLGSAESVVVEPGLGGRIVEAHDGTSSVWGTITEWDPPRRVSFTWHPGQEEHDNHLIEVEFAAAGEGTSVTLRHSGWAWRGAEAESMRNGYESGWDMVLGKYVAAA